jgi:aspartyl aminopeptidase
MTHVLEDFRDFLYHSPTSWHAAVEMGNRLASLDFIPLYPDEKWNLEKGKKYFVIQDGSIASFVLPKANLEQMSIVAAHTDSPALKLKPHPEIEKKNMVQLGVEVYGSPILATWANRDLCLAGRVVVEKENGDIEEFLVFLDEAPVIIPVLAPHLDREAFKKGLELNKQDHLAPIAALQFEKEYVENLIKRTHSFRTLLDFDLFLVPIESPRFIGRNGEMLASYRLDNLSSTHAGLVALGNLKTAHQNTLSMGIFWDHEEVGSSTHIGAESTFFTDIYRRICHFYELNTEDEAVLRRNSLCLSVDVSHALNPNYESKYDPHHAPLLGEGIVLKYNADMRYATGGKTGAFITHLCKNLGLKVQKFVGRSDNMAGSTVGPIFATNLGIETVDIGIPELSMHAAREVISCQDHLDMCLLLTYFLQGGA